MEYNSRSNFEIDQSQDQYYEYDYSLNCITQSQHNLIILIRTAKTMSLSETLMIKKMLFFVSCTKKRTMQVHFLITISIFWLHVRMNSCAKNQSDQNILLMIGCLDIVGNLFPIDLNGNLATRMAATYLMSAIPLNLFQIKSKLTRNTAYEKPMLNSLCKI